MNASFLNQAIRQDIRSGTMSGVTSGVLPNLVQGNVVVLPATYAQEFIAFCQQNPKPCPLIGFSQAGDPYIPNLGKHIDMRFDVPEYLVFEQGEYVKATTDIQAYWQEDSVAVILGCSFSFEAALVAAGYNIRHNDLGRNVPMFNTTIATQRTATFFGHTVVSMRPFKLADVDAIQKITQQYPFAHGSPLHIGDPAKIGITAVSQPDYGDPVPIEDDEVPVFWACGVTTQVALKNAQLPTFITHAPGKMLITELTYNDLQHQLD